MVFTNLFSNALKYTPRGGSVSIVTSGQNTGNGGQALLQMAVTDSGPGVPPAFRERVFDKFFRVEQQTNGDQSGTGARVSDSIFAARSSRRMGA